MSLETIDWNALRTMEAEALKAQMFSIFQDAAGEIQRRPPDDPILLGLVPRIANVIECRTELSGFLELQSALARSVGLWNYIDAAVADGRDEVVAELVSIPKLGISLHREQLVALNSLVAGNNLILSAPTSFGKSALIDALLLTGRYNKVAVVLPTIALLDEFRRRLVERFGSEFDVVMHHSEAPTRDKIIYLGTQERLINREDIDTLDLVVVDEFYKLDPRRRDERSVTLNAAVYKLLSKAAQFFFLGPNIESVTLTNESRWKFEFLKTRFTTVAVDTFDLSKVANKGDVLKEEAFAERNWPALIFVSSPDKANKLAAELTSARGEERLGDGAPLAEWMSENYGERWELSEAVAAGIAVHHGRIPRALASRFVKLFNDRKLPVLICTSTLIEGVNTAAKSVLIYDKKIALSDYDFFTFSNIRGRAGRLGKHHVGQVFLFNEPPPPQDVDVATPLFDNLERAPDELVVHIRGEDITPTVASRVTEISEELGLSSDEVRRYSSLGFDELAALRDSVAELATAGQLSWFGRPTYSNLVATCEAICSVRAAQEFGAGSAKQLAMYLNKLRTSGRIRDFHLWHSESYRGQEFRVDNVFRFLRAAEYSLPEYFGVVELFLTKLGRKADYSLVIAEMPRWFRSEAVKVLEEQGVPIQISERYLSAGDTVSTLGRRLRLLADQEDNSLTELEREWIRDALPI